MGLGGLQHYTIEPSDLERTKDFYCDVLGLENGDRPPLDFPGYWLYSGGTATVHLMGTRKPREGIVVRGTEKKYEDTGRLDHIAFAADDVDGVRKRLNSGLALAGIVVCQVDLRTNHARDVISALRKRFQEDVYAGVIRENTLVAEAVGFQKPITVYDPRSSGAADYRKLAEEFEARIRDSTQRKEGHG